LSDAEMLKMRVVRAEGTAWKTTHSQCWKEIFLAFILIRDNL